MAGERRIAWTIYTTEPAADGWHPLSGCAPPPPPVPDRWDGPHAGLRLADALKTLRLLPAGRGPKPFGSSWPSWEYDFGDRLAQLQQLTDDEREREARAKNHTRIIPSAREIARMEAAIAWPARYLSPYPQLVRAVLAVALARSRGGSSATAARRLRLPRHVVRRWHAEGCDRIARGLVLDRVPVF